jgi:glycosyltransferase involved in cell wall biosynthesis
MRVSVLLACWNAASYVGEALQSVLDQRPAPHEIIAVDDGSTDRSAAVLEGFGTRVVLIRQANSGVGAALNRAAAEATGVVLAFIDADDLWTPGKLAGQTEALAADPELDAVFGFMETFASPDLPQHELSRLRIPERAERPSPRTACSSAAPLSTAWADLIPNGAMPIFSPGTLAPSARDSDGACSRTSSAGVIFTRKTWGDRIGFSSAATIC